MPPAEQPGHRAAPWTRTRSRALAPGITALAVALAIGLSAGPVAADPAPAPATVGTVGQPGAEAGWVTASSPDLSGSGTLIGRTASGSMTYVGLPVPTGDTAAEKKLRSRVSKLDKQLSSAFAAYNASQAAQTAAETKLASVQQQLAEAQARRDAAQAIVDVFVRAAYVGDPAAAGSAELSLLLTKGGPDALHAASLLRYGGQANAKALDLLKQTEAEVADLEKQSQAAFDERKTVATEMADDLASVRVQLDQAETLLGDEVVSQVAAGLGQIPAAVVSSAVTGGEVAPLSSRASTFVLLDGVPAAALPKLSALGLPMTTAVFGKATLGGVAVGVVGIDPNSARSFSAAGMAENDDLWRVIARDEVFASHPLTAAAHLSLGKPVSVTASNGAAATARLGALATLGWPGSDLVMSVDRARSLGAGAQRVLLSTDGTTAEDVTARVKSIVGPKVSITTAGSMAPPASSFLTGRKAVEAFGTMRFVPNADGTVAPDPGWIARNIVTTTVPLLGKVTCHRLAIPQLRGALTEVVQSGLAGTINPGEYAGCYYPRYIEYSASKGLSMHSWGVALDVNVPGNQRGTAGQMDRRVVDIFKRWGFRWGGDWSYTDPMHFELGALLR